MQGAPGFLILVKENGENVFILYFTTRDARKLVAQGSLPVVTASG
jgi:hypothetical protein